MHKNIESEARAVTKWPNNWMVTEWWETSFGKLLMMWPKRHNLLSVMVCKRGWQPEMCRTSVLVIWRVYGKQRIFRTECATCQMHLCITWSDFNHQWSAAITNFTKQMLVSSISSLHVMYLVLGKHAMTQTCILTAIIIDCSSASNGFSNIRRVNVRLQSLLQYKTHKHTINICTSHNRGSG